MVPLCRDPGRGRPALDDTLKGRTRCTLRGAYSVYSQRGVLCAPPQPKARGNRRDEDDDDEDNVVARENYSCCC